jgi:hypothetical protein
MATRSRKIKRAVLPLCPAPPHPCKTSTPRHSPRAHKLRRRAPSCNGRRNERRSRRWRRTSR